MQKFKTRNLALAAIMIALSTVLSFIKIYDPPYGGSVTLASMVPLILLCYYVPDVLALLASVVYAVIQMFQGISTPPTKDFISYAIVILFDYVIAFAVLGLAGIIGRKLRSFNIGAAAVIVLRFLCHFFTGIVIWGVYAPEDTPVWKYSLIYNGGYMLPELIISLAALAILLPVTMRVRESKQ